MGKPLSIWMFVCPGLFSEGGGSNDDEFQWVGVAWPNWDFLKRSLRDPYTKGPSPGFLSYYIGASVETLSLFPSV
jgi:hypothetical protein